MDEESTFRFWHIGIPLGVLAVFFFSGLYSSNSFTHALTGLSGPFAGIIVSGDGGEASVPTIVIVCLIMIVGALVQTSVVALHVSKPMRQSVWAFCWLLWCMSSWFSKFNAVLQI